LISSFTLESLTLWCWAEDKSGCTQAKLTINSRQLNLEHDSLRQLGHYLRNFSGHVFKLCVIRVHVFTSGGFKSFYFIIRIYNLDPNLYRRELLMTHLLHENYHIYSYNKIFSWTCKLTCTQGQKRLK
jgi:hypothetical protein